jgi:translation initiation factor 2B subunit (eIF-2B alpha/beta/delta family)
MRITDPVLGAFEEAANDRRRGASEIERALVASLLRCRKSWLEASVVRGAGILADGQPTMANLRSLAHRAADGDLPGFEAWLDHRARELAVLEERLAAAAWPLLEGASGVVTISRSSAVAAVVEGARSLGWRGTVTVLDGTAAGGGRGLADRLRETGAVESLPDAFAATALETAKVVVLTGADAVGESLFVNASGTRLLLELARARGRLTALVADSGKDVDDAAAFALSERSPIYDDGDRQWPIFESVPLTLVDRRVRESR